MKQDSFALRIFSSVSFTMLSKRKEAFEKALTSATRIFRATGLLYFTISSSSANRDFSHHGKKIAYRYKLAFVSVILVILGYWALISMLNYYEKNTLNIGFVSSSGFWVMILIATVHSYIITPRMKRFFVLCEKALRNFENDLKMHVDYESFAQPVKAVFWKMTCLVISIKSLLIVFTFYYDFDNFDLRIISSLLITYIPSVYIMRFVSSVALIDKNIELIKECLQKIAQTKVSRTNEKLFRMEEIKALVSLKRIHGIVWEMSELINDYSGPQIVVQTVLGIFGNSISAYQIYLVISDQAPFSTLGSKYEKYQLIIS